MDMATDVLSRQFSATFKKAGLERPGSCHLFRHTCATHMLEGGADIRFIQQLLGHEKLETTAIYTEVTILQLQLVHDRCHPASQLETAPPDPAPEASPEASPEADPANEAVDDQKAASH